MKQRATFDTSFWVNAHRSGLLASVLDRVELVFASAVAAEMRASYLSGAEFWRQVEGKTLRLTELQSDHIGAFGNSERAAMSLAVEHPDWVLLLDDQHPFQEAIRRGLNAVCTPVLTLALYAEGALDARQALHVLGKLAAIQTVSPRLISSALAQLGRML